MLKVRIFFFSVFARLIFVLQYFIADIKSSGVFVSLERITQTVEITKHTVDIEEKGVKLKLTIVDTPGFGDAVNNTEWYMSNIFNR